MTELSRGLDTKEKPFKCACGSSFTRRDLLKRHQNITHGTTGGPDNPLPPIRGSSQQPDGAEVSITPAGSHPTAQRSSPLPAAIENLEDAYTGMALRLNLIQKWKMEAF